MITAPPSGNGDNVAVMVSFAQVRGPVDKMVTFIEGRSLNTQYPLEEDAIRTIIFESLNEYVQFALPNVPSGEACSFEHYLSDRFPSVAEIINPSATEMIPCPDKRGIMYLNAQWAIAVGELARQLIPGIRDLNAWGQDCHSMEVFTIPEAVSWDRADDIRRTKVSSALYMLTGIQYSEVDMESEVL